MTDDWREFKRDANRGIRWGIGWWIVIIVIALGLGAAIWGITVATSTVRGQGDGIIKRESAENWVDAQMRFEENYADYESTLVRIETAHTAWQNKPDNLTLEQTYLGTVGYCLELVADYNADARNFLREDFRASDLPASLDPATCNIGEN